MEGLSLQVIRVPFGHWLSPTMGASWFVCVVVLVMVEGTTSNTDSSFATFSSAATTNAMVVSLLVRIMTH